MSVHFVLVPFLSSAPALRPHLLSARQKTVVRLHAQGAGCHLRVPTSTHLADLHCDHHQLPHAAYGREGMAKVKGRSDVFAIGIVFSASALKSRVLSVVDLSTVTGGSLSRGMAEGSAKQLCVGSVNVVSLQSRPLAVPWAQSWCNWWGLHAGTCKIWASHTCMPPRPCTSTPRARPRDRSAPRVLQSLAPSMAKSSPGSGAGARQALPARLHLLLCFFAATWHLPTPPASPLPPG